VKCHIGGSVNDHKQLIFAYIGVCALIYPVTNSSFGHKVMLKHLILTALFEKKTDCLHCFQVVRLIVIISIIMLQNTSNHICFLRAMLSCSCVVGHAFEPGVRMKLWHIRHFRSTCAVAHLSYIYLFLSGKLALPIVL